MRKHKLTELTLYREIIRLTENILRENFLGENIGPAKFLQLEVFTAKCPHSEIFIQCCSLMAKRLYDKIPGWLSVSTKKILTVNVFTVKLTCAKEPSNETKQIVWLAKHISKTSKNIVGDFF